MSAASADDSADADPIVQTLDIQFHPWRDGALHVLSYPLRPAYRPPELPSAARMRPTRRSLETVYARDTSAAHFDSRAANDARMRESRLRSSEVPPKGVQLVGVVDAATRVLHVAPLTSLQVMRPDMTHLDAALKSPPEGLAVPPRPNASQPVKLQTQFRRRDPSTAKIAEAYRRATWAYHIAQEDADPWVDLGIFGPTSDAASAVRSALTAPLLPAAAAKAALEVASADAPAVDAPRSGAREMGVAEYLRVVSAPTAPRSESGDGAIATADSGLASGGAGTLLLSAPIATVSASGFGTGHAGLNVTQTARLPVAAQVEEGLRRAHALPFRRLLELCSSATSLLEVVGVCENLARLVLGNWVLKSDVFFAQPWHVRVGAGASARGSGFVARTSGGAAAAAAGGHPAVLRQATATRYANARDFCLISFAASPTRCVDVAEVCTSTRLSARVVIAILEKLGDLVDEDEVAMAVAATAEEELLRSLAGPTIDNGNVHMQRRKERLGANGSPRLIYRFKQPIDSQFTDRFPAEAEKHRKWWRRREAEVKESFASLAEDDDSDEDFSAKMRGVESAGVIAGASAGAASSDVGAGVGAGAGAALSTGAASGMSVGVDALGAAGADGGVSVSSAPFPPVFRPSVGVSIISGLDADSTRALAAVVDDALSRAGVLTLDAVAQRVRSLTDVAAPRALFSQICAVGCDLPGIALAGHGYLSPAHDSALRDALRVLLADVAALVPVGSKAPECYVRVTCGDSVYDAHRRVAVRLLASRTATANANAGVKKADVIAAIREDAKQPELDLQVNLWLRMMKELGETVAGGGWVLKGTVHEKS